MPPSPMPAPEREKLDQAITDVGQARQALGQAIIALRQVPGVLAESTRLKRDLADMRDVDLRLLNVRYHDDRLRREGAKAGRTEASR